MFAMIGPLRSIAASHGSTTLFKNFHRSYAAGPGLVLFGRSRPVGAMVFSRCHFTTSIRSCTAIAIMSEYYYIAMPTHVVLLHHFREMLLWVLIHGCMYSYLLLLLLLHYGRISIEECLCII